MKEAFETETRRWDFLPEAEPFEAPAACGRRRPRGARSRSRRACASSRRCATGWDELLGHLALLVQWCGLWRDMLFASFAHYAVERLGMAPRTVEQRTALERRLYSLPALRAALRDGRVSYEKARIVAAHADERTVDALIVRAQGMPCIALRRELEAEAEARSPAQMCSARDLDVRVPRHVLLLVAAALHAARAGAGHWLGARGGPRAGRRALHRDLGGEGARPEDPRAEGHRARRGLVPGAGLQPAGRPRRTTSCSAPMAAATTSRTSRAPAPYAARGIRRIMPTVGLCRPRSSGQGDRALRRGIIRELPRRPGASPAAGIGVVRRAVER